MRPGHIAYRDQTKARVGIIRIVIERHSVTLDATVVVPTRNRPAELARCLSALQSQETSVSFEIVVVDDGSEPGVDGVDLGHSGDHPVTLVRTEGRGPARARNAGIVQARSEVILFTDDDTVPTPAWLNAACSFLAEHPHHVGIEGPTTSPPFDPLYFHSVRASTPGSFLTCNVGYRRVAIEAVGGFAELFPSAHAEDLDLGFRITRLGPVGFEPAMCVLHPPRPTALGSEIRRGRRLVSEAHLFRRHPDLYPGARYLSASGYAVYHNAKHWAYSVVRDQYAVGRNPRRALRFLTLALGYSTLGAAALAQDSWRRAGQRRLTRGLRSESS